MRSAAFIVLHLLILSSLAVAQEHRGFSIEGGLIFQDTPVGNAKNEPYQEMSSGFGYTANIAYDFTDWVGLELGVSHSNHNYLYDISGGAVFEETAEKNAFFLRGRGVPIRLQKFELVAAVGPAFFDITGYRSLDGAEEDFSGIGMNFVLNGRYNISEGLAASLFFGASFVTYSRYELFGYRTTYPDELPAGNSIFWGLTLFHRIGIPRF